MTEQGKLLASIQRDLLTKATMSATNQPLALVTL
jgi:hypothetical protein